MLEKDKRGIVSSSSKSKKGEKREEGGGLHRKLGSDFLERKRVSSFSLKYRVIRPSAVFRTRERTALRGEGFAWVPDFRSFLKLQEVGVSPYLGFILYLRAMLMFELNEAVRGRLIGPKS